VFKFRVVNDVCILQQVHSSLCLTLLSTLATTQEFLLSQGITLVEVEEVAKSTEPRLAAAKPRPPTLALLAPGAYALYPQSAPLNDRKALEKWALASSAEAAIGQLVNAKWLLKVI